MALIARELLNWKEAGWLLLRFYIDMLDLNLVVLIQSYLIALSRHLSRTGQKGERQR